MSHTNMTPFDSEVGYHLYNAGSMGVLTDWLGGRTLNTQDEVRVLDPHPTRIDPRWSNGRTADFDSAGRGSIP